MVTHEQAEEKVKLGFVIHLIVYVIVVGALLAMNFSRHPDRLWSVWVACGWGVGILLHGFGVFVNPKSRERMIQRTMARLERRSEAQQMRRMQSHHKV